MHLTKRLVTNSSYQGPAGVSKVSNARCVLWDDDPRGLGLRIFPPRNGRPEHKAFILSYRNSAGRSRLYTIGDVQSCSLEQARTRAKQLIRDIEDRGADPVHDKRARKLEAATGTVEAMVRAYLDARAADPRRPMRTHAAALQLAERHVFPKFGSRPWRDLHRSELRDWHGRFTKIPHQGNRALELVKAAYNWRIKQEDDSALGARASNPAWGIGKFPETPRQVRLELADLPRLEAAIDAVTPDPYLRAYFRFVLATGCRRSEALGLRWENVNLASKTAAATFLETKTEPRRTVPLAPATVQLLKRLPRMDAQPFVFAGRLEGAPLVGIDKIWRQIRSRAELPGLRIHDLRRTFGSWLGDAGLTSKQIGTLLGHKTDITSRVYMALGEQSSRAAVAKAQALMRRARQGKRARRAK